MQIKFNLYELLSTMPRFDREALGDWKMGYCSGAKIGIIPSLQYFVLGNKL